MSEWLATSWTLVGEGGEGSKEALEELCRIYRPVLVGIIRSRGHRDPEDIAQNFVMTLLAGDFFANADRGRGPFRDYITGALFRHLAQHYRDAHAQKRGSGKADLSFEAATPHQRDSWLENPCTPEDIARREEANAAIHRATLWVAAEYGERGETEAFEQLRPFLLDDPEPGQYAAIAERNGTSPSAVSSAVARIRNTHRYAIIGQLTAPRRNTFRFHAPPPPPSDPNADPDERALHHWAAITHEQSRALAREQYEGRGKAARFDALIVFLAKDPTQAEYQELIAKIDEDTPDEAFDAIERMRRLYRSMLGAAVENTCRRADGLVYELMALRKVLGI